VPNAELPLARVGVDVAGRRIGRYAEAAVTSARFGEGWIAVATGVRANDMNGVVSHPNAVISVGGWRRGRDPITSHRSGILAHVVDDVLRCWPVTHRWRTTSPDVRRTGYRRVKVRWVTPLGDETASMS
jgi:hypothetical protein